MAEPSPAPPASCPAALPPANPNGWEPRYAPEVWNADPERHNCFAYALNETGNGARNLRTLQPGDFAGITPRLAQPLYTCEEVHSRLMADARAIHPESIRAVAPDQACPAGTYRIALSVDPQRDFHFYRQDPDGSWSHKIGGDPAHRLQEGDPRCAAPRYSVYEYSQFCGFYCVSADIGADLPAPNLGS
jgi:hypothetical protein